MKKVEDEFDFLSIFLTKTPENAFGKEVFLWNEFGDQKEMFVVEGAINQRTRELYTRVDFETLRDLGLTFQYRKVSGLEKNTRPSEVDYVLVNKRQDFYRVLTLHKLQAAYLATDNIKRGIAKFEAAVDSRKKNRYWEPGPSIMNE